jgi:cysteine synthase
MEMDLIHEAISVSDRDAYDMADRLVREEGLLVGGSAGAAVAAAVQVASRGGSGPIVAMLPDSWDRYQTSHFNPDWRAEHGV